MYTKKIHKMYRMYIEVIYNVQNVQNVHTGRPADNLRLCVNTALY